MAEEKKENEEEVEEKKGGGGLKIILIVLIVVLIAGGAGAFFMLQKTDAPVKKKEIAVDEIGPMFALPALVVNLDEPGGTRYLKLSLKLELRKPLTPKQQKLTVRYRDRTIVYLSSLRISETQKPKEKKKLRKKLKRIANRVYGRRSVRHVYFKDFVIQ